MTTHRSSVVVVVVGAGLSGLSCAHSLLADHGVCDVAVLEARDRIGGRVHTVVRPAGGEGRQRRRQVLELGAQWLHGSDGSNSVLSFALKEGLLGPKLDLAPNENVSEHLSVDLRRPDGRALDREAVGAANEAYTGEDGICQRAERVFLQEYSKGGRGWKGKSVLDFFQQTEERTKKDFRESGRTESFLFDLECAFLVLRRAMEGYVGGDLSRLSVELFGSSLELPGDDVIVEEVDGGMAGIVRALAEPLGNRVRLSCEVTEIELREDKALVRFRDGRGDPMELTADFVVCTVPIGILKAKHQTMFRNPPLPRSKVKAIDLMGEGSLSKIFLEWDDPFWSDLPFYALTPAWSEEETREAEADPDRLWTRGVYNVLSVGERVLLCWITGRFAAAADSKSDEEVGLQLGDLIRRFSANPSLLPPDRVVRNPWLSDPHSLGVYSCPLVGAEGVDLEELCRPMPSEESPRLLFAGEAMEPRFWSSLHGSRLSGLREAQRIAKLLGSK